MAESLAPFSQGHRRILSIDASRGIAMLLVCVSHFVDNCIPCDAPGQLVRYVRAFTLAATPTFVLLSGILLGFLHYRCHGRFARTKVRLIDRGLFLLVVVHPALVLANAVSMRSLPASSRIFYVTDMLAVTFIVAPYVVERLGRPWRGVLALWTFAFSTVLVAILQPERPLWCIIGEVLLGANPGSSSHSLVVSFPVLPWFSVYLIATVVGSMIAESYETGQQRRVAIRLLFFAISAMPFAVFLRFLLRWLFTSWMGRDSTTAIALSSTFGKFPPALPYLFLYGGAGLVIVALAMLAEHQGRFLPVLGRVSLLGQASLFAFVLQYVVYGVASRFSTSLHGIQLLALFLLTLVVIYLPSVYWSKQGYNRRFTVGYAQFVKSREQSQDHRDGSLV